MSASSHCKHMTTQIIAKTAERAVDASNYFNRARGDWICSICGSANFADRGLCMLCQSKRRDDAVTSIDTTTNILDASSSTTTTSNKNQKKVMRTPHWHADAVFLQWWKSRVVDFVTKESDEQSVGVEREVSSKYLSNDDFTWRLDNFLWQRRRMKTRELTLGGLPLCFKELYTLVLKGGGYDNMLTQKGAWAKVFKALPNYSKKETSASCKFFKFCSIQKKVEKVAMNLFYLPISNICFINFCFSLWCILFCTSVVFYYFSSFKTSLSEIFI